MFNVVSCQAGLCSALHALSTSLAPLLKCKWAHTAPSSSFFPRLLSPASHSQRDETVIVCRLWQHKKPGKETASQTEKSLLRRSYAVRFFFKSRHRATWPTFTWPDGWNLWLSTAGWSDILEILCGQTGSQHVFTRQDSSRVIQFQSWDSITRTMFRAPLNSGGTSEQVRKRWKLVTRG